MKNDLTRDLILEAIKEGVKEAILTMTESGDGITGEIIREPFLKAIQDGVEDAVRFNMPSEREMSDLIYAAFRAK